MSIFPKSHQARALITGACVLLGATACLPDQPDQSAQTAINRSSTQHAMGPKPTLSSSLEGNNHLQELAEYIAGNYGEDNEVGIALAGPGDHPSTAGDINEAPAWSTIKIPLAIAALRHDPGQLEQVERAVTVSDNEAAAALWQSLGDPMSAKAAVEQVLREAGDNTEVETEHVRPEFSTYGQSIWSVSDQASFALALPSLAGAQPVIDAMGRISDEQAYGLGRIPGATFKGGWGPDPDGRYLVRQFGSIDTGCGAVGVSVAVRPASGSYEDAQGILNGVAGELTSHLCA